MNTSLSVQKMEQRYDTIHVTRAKFVIVPLPFEELHLLPWGWVRLFLTPAATRDSKTKFMLKIRQIFSHGDALFARNIISNNEILTLRIMVGAWAKWFAADSQFFLIGFILDLQRTKAYSSTIPSGFSSSMGEKLADQNIFKPVNFSDSAILD